MKKYWLLVFIAVLGVRIFFSTFSYNADLNNILRWTDSIRDKGMHGFYERDFYPYSQANYPPLITSSYYYLDSVSRAVFPNNYEARTTFNKLPTIIFESLLISFSLLLFPAIFFFTYLLNPAIFYNSVLWGQTEGLVAALLMISLYLIFKKKAYAGTLAFTAALLVKQSALIFLPLIVFLLVKKISFKKIILPVLVSVVVYTASFIPYYGYGFIQKSFSFLVDVSQGQSHLASVNALNMWYLLGLNKVSDNIGYILTYQVWGIILSISLIAFIIYHLSKKISFENSLIAAGLINFAVCIFLTRIHERHLLPSLVLLIPLAIKSKLNFLVYVLVSAIYFANLYLIWHEMFASYDKSTLKLLSALAIACFTYFFINFIGLSKRNN